MRKHLGEGERHEREVGAAQAVPEGERADEGADQCRRRDAVPSPSHALSP